MIYLQPHRCGVTVLGLEFWSSASSPALSTIAAAAVLRAGKTTSPRRLCLLEPASVVNANTDINECQQDRASHAPEAGDAV